VNIYRTAPITELWITSTGGSDFPFAIVYLKNRIVIGVQHNISEQEIVTSDDLFNALFTASERLAEKHTAACQLQTGSSYLTDAGLSKASVILYCGPYRVVILRNEFKNRDGKSVSSYILREELGQTD
jgi:hypothetical protein